MAVKKKVSAKVTKSSTTLTRADGKPRAKLRFLPDTGTLAEIGIKLSDGKQKTLYGLVLNESIGGAAIVIVTDEKKIRQDMPCLCKVGKMAATTATIRWVELIEKNLVKLGIEYDS